MAVPETTGTASEHIAPPGLRLRAGRALRSRANWLQLARFCVVGGIGYLVNLAVYTALLDGAATASIRRNTFRSNMRMPLGQQPYSPDSFPALSLQVRMTVVSADIPQRTERSCGNSTPTRNSRPSRR